MNINNYDDHCNNKPNLSLLHDGNQLFSPNESFPAETHRSFIHPLIITPPSPPQSNNLLFPPSPPIVINDRGIFPHEDSNDRHLAASSLLSLNKPVSPNTELHYVAAESLYHCTIQPVKIWYHPRRHCTTCPPK